MSEPQFTEDQLNAVREAAKGLDPAVDAHWTKAGDANCNALTELCKFTVTKDMLAAADVAKRPAQTEGTTDTSAVNNADAQVDPQQAEAKAVAGPAPAPTVESEPDASAEPPRQATLAECNAMMRKTEQTLKEQAKVEAALNAAAFLKERG